MGMWRKMRGLMEPIRGPLMGLARICMPACWLLGPELGCLATGQWTTVYKQPMQNFRNSYEHLVNARASTPLTT